MGRSRTGLRRVSKSTESGLGRAILDDLEIQPAITGHEHVPGLRRIRREDKSAV